MRKFSEIAVLLVCAQLAACQSAQRVEDVRGAHVHSFDESRIVYDAEGAGEPALVFIHGWCCNRGQWENQVPEFLKDYRVVAIDLAGHGASGDTRTDWTLRGFARDVEAVIVELDLDEVILVGHSMGGPVSLLVAARMPDRVLGVIGVDTLHNAEFEFPEAFVNEIATGFEQDFKGTMNGFFDSMYGEESTASKGVVARLKRDAMQNDPIMAAELMRRFAEFDTPEAFRACPVAIHCINAAGPNPTRPDINRKYNDQFHVVYIDNVGHWPQLEKPEAFNEKLRGRIEAIAGGEPTER